MHAFATLNVFRRISLSPTI